MQPKALKHILDIESAIREIEAIVLHCNANFERFEKEPMAIRSLERLLEIIGEAIKKLLNTDHNLQIEHAHRIIALRNRLAHAYDSIENAIIWAIAIKNIPKLKNELEALRR